MEWEKRRSPIDCPSPRKSLIDFNNRAISINPPPSSPGSPPHDAVRTENRCGGGRGAWSRRWRRCHISLQACCSCKVELERARMARPKNTLFRRTNEIQACRLCGRATLRDVVLKVNRIKSGCCRIDGGEIKSVEHEKKTCQDDDLYVDIFLRNAPQEKKMLTTSSNKTKRFLSWGG